MHAAWVLKVVMTVFDAPAFTNSSRGFHSPWMIDTAIDSSVFWDSEEKIVCMRCMLSSVRISGDQF